jgi:hypothetical protein
VSLTARSEYGALENFLEAQRIGLIRKVEGISDEVASADSELAVATRPHQACRDVGAALVPCAMSCST